MSRRPLGKVCLWYMMTIGDKPFILCYLRQFLPEICHQLGNSDAFLFRGVAIAHGNGIVLQGLKIYGYAPGRADFVLRVIPLSDIAAIVPTDRKMRF